MLHNLLEVRNDLLRALRGLLLGLRRFLPRRITCNCTLTLHFRCKY